MMSSRTLCLILVWGSFLGAAPAFAHKAYTKPCEARLVGEEAQNQLLGRFESLEHTLKEIFRTYQKLPYTFISEFELAQRLAILMDSYRHRLDETLSQWDPSSEQSAVEAEKVLTALDYKIARLKDENRLWQNRYFVNQKSDLAEFRGDRMMILPNRTYTVLTDRGESMRVRFSQDLVVDFLWLTTRDGQAEAADKALDAIARGFQPAANRAAAGICVYRSAIGGETVYGLKFKGRGGVGAHRIFGLMKDGVIGFVVHEAEQAHDCKYIRRVIERTIMTHRAQGW